MANIEPISILREKNKLDKVNQTNEPLYITKNGKAYLVLLSHNYFEEIITERNYYKQVFEREREMKELILKVKKSRKNIEQGQSYSEDEFDKMMDNFS